MFQEKSLSLLIGLLFLALSPSLASESLQLEVQSVSTNTSGRGDWEAVQFDTEFSEVPVVVASPPAYGGNQPVSIAIRNVTTLGFEFQVREWEYLDGSHNEETVSFLALEPGVHQFGDKTIIAGRSQASTSDPAGGVPVDFSLSMIDPVVLAQIEFVTAELTATPRVSAIDSNGFSLQLQLEEAVHGSVSFDCMVSWIAAETGTASVDGVNLMVGSESVSSDWKEIDFGINAPTPYFFGEMQSVNEPDTATLRIRNLSEISVSVKVEEEASLDEEVDHGDESIGFFVLWKDLSPKLEIGEIEVSVLGDGAWWRVELNYSYDNPVVIIGPPTASLEEPIITSIRNVEPDSFEVRLHPWDYQSDRQHPLEKISFLVMESGVYSLGGLTWEAGHSEAGSSQFTTQSFRSVEFQESPVVVTALESEFADGAAISRIRNVTEGSFQLRLYEEQGADGLRPLETVHYLAVSEGAAELFDGAVVRVETHLDVDSDWNTAQFSSWLDEGFYIGAFQTVNGADPGALRIKNLLPNQVDARFEEERSADDEVSHVGEALGSIYFGVPQVSMEEGVDFDADGLTNRDEILNLGTNPKLSDTDGDGLSDSVEVAGLSDARRSDTDGDGLGDAWELNHGFDVNAAETGIHASYADADGDGWTNAHEAEREMDPFSADEVRGFWIREHWENIRLYSTFLLVKDSRFFAPPSEIVPQVGSSTGEIFKSNFANRIRGYIEAPETGEYQFWISGKTAAELWLSTDDSKFNKRLIARLGPEFGSGHGVGINHNFKWNAFVSQQSVMISLQAGERYFIEVLQQHGHTKEAHASVAWARPGGERESIPGDFIISYAHVDTDQDDDSLPDDWEQAFGLNSFDDGRSDRGREGQWGDFDSDGLSNHDEYILQLNPAVDDSQTYLESISNSANRIELGDSLIESFPGALVLGEGWTLMSDDSIQAEYRRARRTFDLDIAQPGHYKAQLLIGDVAQADGIRNTAVKLFLNGVFLGRYGVLLPVEGPGQLTLTLPFLQAGQHELTVLHDEIAAGRHLRVFGLNFYSVQSEGAAQIVRSANDLTISPFATSVSPMFVEGRQRYPGAAEMTADGVAVGLSEGPGDVYFSFVPLPASGDPVSLRAAFEDETESDEVTVSWATTPILNVADDLQILLGSSLRLAIPAGSESRSNAAIIVNGPQGWNKYTNFGEAVEYRFDLPGRYKLRTTWNESGSPQAEERFVRVSSAAFDPDYRDLKLGKTYAWRVSSQGSPIENYLLEADEAIVGEIEDEGGNWRRFRIGADETGNHDLALRLGSSTGPISGQATLSSFEAVAALRTETELVAEFGNGDRIYRSAVAIDNFPEGATVEISIFVGGVIFTDGTISKTFVREDFGDTGIIELEFYYPSGTKSSICHRLKLYDQDGNAMW